MFALWVIVRNEIFKNFKKKQGSHDGLFCSLLSLIGLYWSKKMSEIHDKRAIMLTLANADII